MNLEDLKPMPSKIELEGKTYKLRQINLNDEIWLKKTFGTQLANLFSE
jgi:hypothetical protein